MNLQEMKQAFLQTQLLTAYVRSKATERKEMPVLYAMMIERWNGTFWMPTFEYWYTHAVNAADARLQFASSNRNPLVRPGLVAPSLGFHSNHEDPDKATRLWV